MPNLNDVYLMMDDAVSNAVRDLWDALKDLGLSDEGALQASYDLIYNGPYSNSEEEQDENDKD